MLAKFLDRFNMLREDERGMEAAQVILILVIVVVGLIPVITMIRNAISAKGAGAANSIKNS